MPLGLGRGQNVGLGDFCNILTLLPPGASVFHKHISCLSFSLLICVISISDFASASLDIGESLFNSALSSKAATSKRAMHKTFPEVALPKHTKGKSQKRC